MPESIVEQILAAIKTSLEAITGDDGTTYWYTPGTVVRTDYFDSRQMFRTGFGDYLYFIRDTGDENETVDPTAFGERADDLDVFIMLAAQDTRGDRDPFTATLLSGTIRNRMVKDVVKKLEGDLTLGGVAFNIRAGLKRRDFVEPEGWILAEVHFIVTYYHTLGSP
jgi:hypothetical protein